ncbi:MAG TPA: hypothetical protein VGM88_08015 [Kofleriaceae bacterium]|jgi:hypothetical protein
MRAAPLALLCLLGSGLCACDDTDDDIIGQLNLDRPMDIAFGCWGDERINNGEDPTLHLHDVHTGAMPLSACTTYSGAPDSTGKKPAPDGQQDLTAMGGDFIGAVNWYGFVLQSAPGTVALVNFETKPSSSFTGADIVVMDADPLTPGKGAISVGQNPIAITTDKPGCKMVTANAGSCDMSVLDVATAVDEDTTTPVHVDRLPVKTASGATVLAKPAAMVAEPSEGPAGYTCGGTAIGKVFVAYPACHAIAEIDVSSGTVLSTILFDANGTAHMDSSGELTCPNECGTTIGATTAGYRPVTMDLEDVNNADPVNPITRRRLAVGADNSNIVNIIELDPTTSAPQSVQPVVLQENSTSNLGITSIALSPEMGMGGTVGSINDDNSPGGLFEFVYGVATDGTVRVADVLTLYQECDTEIDPRYVRSVRGVKQVSCFPVGVATNPPRRAEATGPGIQFPRSSMPISVAIFRADPIDGDTAATSATKMIGYYAIVTSSNGPTYVVNIDDDNYPDLYSFTDSQRIETEPPFTIAHQLRDSYIGSRDMTTALDSTNTDPAAAMLPASCEDDGPDPDGSSGNSGPPRITTTQPSFGVPPGYMASNKTGYLPQIRSVTCTPSSMVSEPVSELAFTAPPATRDADYPDVRDLFSDETITLTWEGPLSNDTTSTTDIDGPKVRESAMTVDETGIQMIDDSHPYCDAGVEAGDIVQIVGCDPQDGDADCPLGYTCFVHPDSQVTDVGACMLADEASRLASSCKDFLTSLRRYTVAEADSGVLRLLPRKHELRTTPIDGCTSNQQCSDLASYEIKLIDTSNPVDDMTAPDKHTWSCEADAYRQPLAGTGNRCVETCTTTTDCAIGTVCEYGYCLEGPTPAQSCVNGPQLYSILGGDSFVVIGSKTGYVHPIIEGPDGKCMKDPNASPFQIGRIPLTAPACDPDADPVTGVNPNTGAHEANPCSYTATTTEYQEVFTNTDTCTLDTTASAMATEQQVGGIKYNGPGLSFTLVNPTFHGDAKCIGDNAGTLGNIPHVFDDYQVSFRLTAGLTPFVVPAGAANEVSYPVKVVRGPTQSVWIMDEGDYISETVTIASTKGKVFRAEITDISLINIME